MRPKDIEKERLVMVKAIELVVRDGIQGFSMAKLAKECRLSVGTLYVYFKDKDELIKTLGKDIGIKFFTTISKGFSPEMSFKDGLWKQWENRIAFARENPLCHQTAGVLVQQVPGREQAAGP